MDKVKVNPKIVAILLLGGLFAGWQYMLLICAFALVFCHKDDEIKSLMIKVLVLLAAVSLFGKLWNLVEMGYSLGVDGIKGLFTILGSINADITLPLWLSQYILIPLGTIISWLGQAVSFLIVLVEFNFILATIMGNSMPKPFSKIDEYMTKFTDFISDKISLVSKDEKVCSSCGATIKESASFCTKCGNKFDK